MQIDVNLHFHVPENFSGLLKTIGERLNTMANELDALKAAVQKNNDVIDSAITLIQGIKTALDNAIASNDPAALTALSAQLGTEDDKLAAAVAANTPAAPAPTPPAAA